MHHLSAFDDLAHKTVADVQSVLQLFLGANQQVHRRHQTQSPSDGHCLQKIASFIRHNHQQIEIGFRRRLAIGVRAEEDDLLRFEFLGDAPANIL